MAEARCLACGGQVVRLGQRQGWDYGCCTACGAVQLMSPPTDEELSRLYREEYHRSGHLSADPSAQDKERRRVVLQMADIVAQHHRTDPGGLVVELGAGWGALGQELVLRGIRYRGLEPNHAMAEHARSRGLDIVTGDLDQIDAVARSERIHTFVSMAVYEHLLHQTDVLCRQAELITANGEIIIQAPSAGIPRAVGRLFAALQPQRELPGLFGSLAPPWHVLLPTPQSIRAQAARCGLQLKQVLVSNAGRRRDFRRLLQIASEQVGRAGHGLLGERWPLSVAHIYVLGRSPSEQA